MSMEVEESAAGRRTVVVLSFSDLARDPRVNRQIRFLRERYRVVAVGYADPRVEGVEFVPVRLRGKSVAGRIASAVQLLTGRFERYYWRQHHVLDLAERLAGVRADVIVANDIDTLPLALRVAGDVPVVFDAHEYAPLEFEDRIFFRLFLQRYRTYLCRTYIPRTAGMMTVCESIAEAYERDTGVRPAVVLNAPDHEPLEPVTRPPGDRTIRLVHHGGANPSRKLDRMIRMMDDLAERFVLDLLLVEAGGGGEIERLKRLAHGNDRIRFLDPVPMRELPRFLNAYDVGIFILPPTNFNYRYALPNKLFEFIQARLAVAVSPSPEMARVVRETGCGVVSRDFSPQAMAEVLRTLDRERIEAYKRRSHEAARELSAERSRATLLEVVDRVVQRRSHGPVAAEWGSDVESREG